MSASATFHHDGNQNPPHQRIADQPMLLVFIALALIARLTFWLYTGRVWEDALISLTPARNVWDGVGLTHHGSEPYVHSFTSPLGELILILGEGFGEGYGLLAMRLASLAASVAAIIYADRLCRHLRLHWSAQILVLGFLATDQLHVFFGMAGVETQVATALVLANAVYFVERRWMPLGIATGLAVICRPEFLLWPAIVVLALALEWRKGRRDEILPFVLPAAAVAVPWLLFATIYYGSPVPHTIVVKSYVARIFVENIRLSAYLADSWKHIAPFHEFTGFSQVPLPDGILKGIVALLLALALAGAIHAVRQQPRMLAVLAFVVGFFVYRTAARVNPYFMWYLPPFTALLVLFAACGVSWLATRQKTLAIMAGCGLFVCYAAHLPFSLPLDRLTQEAIEDGVRVPIGKALNAMMTAQDAVLLEPLGFVGWEAKNKTIYDFPGLGSPRAFAAYRKHGTVPGMIRELSPRFLLQRPSEWDTLSREAPDVAARYEAVRTIAAPASVSLRIGGAAYHDGDRAFTIYRLRAP